MSRRVLRADFLRYLLLAVEGGVYSDADTTMLRPVSQWVPEKYAQKAKLIVGIEADTDVPTSVSGAAYQVQFAMWTLASSPNHPVLWAMIDRILSTMADRPIGAPIRDNDVLSISGPKGWSTVVYAGLSDAAGREINYTHVKDLQEPVLYGDILVLPLYAFAADFNEPGAASKALVKHKQAASWRFAVDVIG